MKNYKNYKKLILEVGESNVEPYEILDVVEINYYGAESVNYIFETDSGLQYSINLLRNMGTLRFKPHDVEKCDIVDEDSYDGFNDATVGISYFTYEGEELNIDTLTATYNDTIITNRGELYKIMATLVSVMEKYLKENPEVKYLFIGGQRGDKPGDKEQREKLYLKYLLSKIPSGDVGEIFVEITGEYYPIVKIK